MIRRKFHILLVGACTAICFGMLAMEAEPAKDDDENGLHEVSADFSSPTRLRKTQLTGGGLIERVTDDVIMLNTGDEVVLAEETQVLVSPGKFGPVPKGATRVDLSPGTPVKSRTNEDKRQASGCVRIQSLNIPTTRNRKTPLNWAPLLVRNDKIQSHQQTKSTTQA
jgi:hypothetical protein